MASRTWCQVLRRRCLTAIDEDWSSSALPVGSRSGGRRNGLAVLHVGARRRPRQSAAGLAPAVAVGDINGDLFDDLLVGAPRAKDASQTGAVFVLFGGSAQLGQMYYLDADGDGYGDNAVSHLRVRSELRDVQRRLCHRESRGANPGNLETCGNILHEDCLSSNDDLWAHRDVCAGYRRLALGVDLVLRGTLRGRSGREREPRRGGRFDSATRGDGS
jgi:hypothetical protein